MASQARIESNTLLKRWALLVTGDVLALGSGDDHDRQGHTYRQYFTKARSYTTSECGESAAGCDLSLDIRAMPEIADGRYDAIFCSGVLEHVDMIGAAMKEIWRVLAPGGTLLLGVPFRQAIHRGPQDFWRFTEFGVRHLLSGYEGLEVVAIDRKGNPDFPSAYWVRAQKPGRKTEKPAPSVRDIPPSVAEPLVEPPRELTGEPSVPLSVVCWLWPPENGYRATYGPEHVNTLRRMVVRNYPKPHRFLCVTEHVDGLDPEIGIIPPWSDHVGIPSPHGKRFPGCYRRLRAFHPDIAQTFGPRFVSLDLDCVITGDLRPLWDRPEPFVAWRDTHPAAHYNGSMILMTAGARSHVWETFDPATSPQVTLANGKCNGSDQGWISFVLGPNEATWTAADGVYSFKNELMPLRPRGRKARAEPVEPKPLPADARIVFWHGKEKPWGFLGQRLEWVKACYR